MTDDSASRPLSRVVRGEPTAEELAALTVVLAARAAAASAASATSAEKPPEPRSEWRDKAPLLRRPLRHGPGAWRASARPH